MSDTGNSTINLFDEQVTFIQHHLPGLDAGETLRLVKEAGGEAFAVTADMRDPAAVTAMVKKVAKQGGRLDYVVSNAAINRVASCW